MATKGDCVADATGLCVNLGGQRIVSEVSLSICSGEILALLGPNGAGKTTLVRALTGRVTRSGGSIRVAGEDPARSSRARRSIGFVPQKITLYERLTPRENLSAFGALMGVRSRDIAPRLRHLLDLVGLTSRIDDPVKALSGGMRRRVNIAVALMHKPRLLVLDEPSAGLDFTSRRLVVDILGKLSSEGIGTLLITHDTAEAELLADRIAVMVAGRICAVGTRAELLSNVFGHCREIRLVRPIFRGGPTKHRLDDILFSVGLLPDETRDVWSGLVSPVESALPWLMNELSRGSLYAEEITIRDANLDTLVAQFMAET